MKIALVASIWIRIPPKGFGFGAQEYIAYALAEGLTRKGHEVTLFATGDSSTSARLVSVSPTEVSSLNFPDPKIKDMFELMNLSEAYRRSSEFDIIHNHLLPYGLLFVPLSRVKTVHTLHHVIYQTRADVFLYEKYKDQRFISISNAQRTIFPKLNYIGTIYNGVDTSFYTFQEKPMGDYLLYIGRMKKYKGIHTAIRIAKELGLKLKIAAPLPQPNQADFEEVNAYWLSEIKPQLSPSIEHLNEISGEEKVNLLKHAKAFLFPVEREEPFGMTVIEAMACGTPVVAYGNGSVPELVVDGKTGFVISAGSPTGTYTIRQTGFAGLKEAVQRILSLPEQEYHNMRLNSRAHIENCFTTHAMVEAYEKIYRNVLQSS